MKQGRISQTALKVALGLITLSVKDDWSQRLPPDLVAITERLLLASGSPGYGPGLMRMSKQRWMIRVYQFQDRMMPGQWEGFGHRKVFMNQQVEAAIEQGARQVLVLGAGFDTLCLRLAPKYPEVRFVEIDHPSTSVAKARGIEKVGQPENMIQIAADLGERSLPKVLSEDGHWDASQRSVIVAEGLFQYLTDEEVRGLLTDAGACTSPGSRIAFSHAIPGDRKLLSALVRLISEPWKSEVRSEDLPSYVDGTGWAMISDVDDDAEHGVERYGVAERA
ncbi:MAG: SAM-dependent methyltransferase [Deltaproteobacteria bacterium]|nr:SAM-dependent methyltransferase [Deltaproteobacteria bacterium]